MWVCFPPSDDYYALEVRVADKVYSENKLEFFETTFQLLKSGKYFYCVDLLGSGWCIETTQLFGFSK